MIEWLRGRVVHRVDSGGRVVLDVNGVGYGIEVAVASVMELPAEGEMLELHIVTVMSDSAIRLFGFLDGAGRELFEVVTTVNGVGPKLGLALVSALGTAGFARAVIGQDLRALKAVPGVGAKMAERLVLELRDKMERFAVAAEAGHGQNTNLPPGGAATYDSDVVGALVSMGVKPAVAERAAARALEALGAGASFQELMREALRHR